MKGLKRHKRAMENLISPSISIPIIKMYAPAALRLKVSDIAELKNEGNKQNEVCVRNVNDYFRMSERTVVLIYR